MHGRRFATARYTTSGFRFRYRKAWGFKSLLVHYSETIRELGDAKIDS
jgi:hypothetical protein